MSLGRRTAWRRTAWVGTSYPEYVILDWSRAANLYEGVSLDLTSRLWGLKRREACDLDGRCCRWMQVAGPDENGTSRLVRGHIPRIPSAGPEPCPGRRTRRFHPRALASAMDTEIVSKARDFLRNVLLSVFWSTNRLVLARVLRFSIQEVTRDSSQVVHRMEEARALKTMMKVESNKGLLI